MAKGNDNDRYVQPNKQRGGWDIVKEGHQRVSAHTHNKAQAINRARQIIRNEGGGELRIKNERGRLIDSDTIVGPKHKESRGKDRK
jgi:Uncharacterized protein conserved in bacteria (DUF2188)